MLLRELDMEINQFFCHSEGEGRFFKNRVFLVLHMMLQVLYVFLSGQIFGMPWVSAFASYPDGGTHYPFDSVGMKRPFYASIGFGFSEIFVAIA